MGTTTIRVDTDTHARLLDLGKESGTSLIETVRDATEALSRQRFANQVSTELDKLHENPQAWEAYLAEAEDTSVSDGIG